MATVHPLRPHPSTISQSFNEQEDTVMSNVTIATISKPKTREISTVTVKAPPFAYIHLADPVRSTTLDDLQVRSYCTAACRQFLGEHGAAISVDVLAVRDGDAWLRVPQQDLNAFSAAIAAYSGTSSGLFLMLKACGDWLGNLVGRDEQEGLWS
jgi:ribonuclease P/MRP protein subunit POP8